MKNYYLYTVLIINNRQQRLSPVLVVSIAYSFQHQRFQRVPVEAHCLFRQFLLNISMVEGLVPFGRVIDALRCAVCGGCAGSLWGESVGEADIELRCKTDFAVGGTGNFI